MEIIELLLDEENETAGIDAISIVSSPAIESNFLAFKSQEIKFAKVDDEKRILMGAALIPNKPIYRKDEKKEYYVYFSADTVRKASELFFMNGNQNNATLEHNMDINGLSVVESWIVEDAEMDKTKKYGLDVPVGTWMVSMKVNNDEIWNEYVKTDKVKGFSIEGYFADKANMKASAENIAEKEAEEKIEQIRNLFKKKIDFKTQIIDDNYAIIDNRLAYNTQAKAEEMAINIGCSGFHTHEFEGKTWYMPCETHINKMYKKCPKGYKKKNGKCVKI